MQAGIDALAMVVMGAGVAVLLLAATLRACWRSAVPVALELWVAAGLLRLCGEPTWARVGTAAALVLVRTLITARRRA